MRLSVYIVVLVVGVFLSSACEKSIQISNKGNSEYRIVIPANATKSELRAASFLQRSVDSVAGVRLPIIRDKSSVEGKEISIGKTNRLEQLNHAVQVELEPDGFSIFAENDNLYFTGGSDKAIIYASSSFIEHYVGMQVLSSKVQVFESKKKITIPNDLDWTYNPPFDFRSTHYRDTWDPFFADWHKLHHLPNGGHPDWGYWCHSFNQLVPPSEYYESNPEYFAEINGNRVPAQLCLTNPDVLRITIKNLRKAIEEKPDLKYWSVSQNDNVSYCQCEECQKLDQEHNSPMGSLLTYVNAVADSFPDYVISTLAYQYSRKPPENIVPRENVNIMLCTIELNRAEPISSSDDAASFRSDLEGWGEICDDILLWDYVIQFMNLVSPFPNLHVLKPNLEYFLENNATKHFQQGNREIGGEHAELRAYLISKLLWEPHADVDSLENIFLNGYYEDAAQFIKKYIDTQHQALINSGARLDIFGHPIHATNSYLTQELMEVYEDLFDKAEKAVQSDSEVLARVQQARMPLQYAQIEIATRLGTADGGMYERDESGLWRVKDEIKVLADTLVSRALRQGVTRFSEWHTTPTEYLAGLKKSWAVDMQDHLAMNIEPEFMNDASPKYAAGNAKVLTDGLRGPALTYAYNWLGFEGVECEAIVELPESQSISFLSTSWLHDVRSWVFTPKKVTYFGSKDGKEWLLLGESDTDIDIQSEGVQVVDFSIDLPEVTRVKYVKVKSSSLINCPVWHPGAGGPAWIFIDEIIVK